mmetsp:Transcript_10813/g.22549  ORF Transcript_10813/g.22549 Transcript_10813/m.22549 type:complete len:321 (-) Transcript_10813:509-1471(-)
MTVVNHYTCILLLLATLIEAGASVVVGPCSVGFVYLGQLRPFAAPDDIIATSHEKMQAEFACADFEQVQLRCKVVTFAFVDDHNFLANRLEGGNVQPNNHSEAEITSVNRRLFHEPQFERMAIIAQDIIQYELDNDMKFTWIVRLRPDLFFVDEMPCVKFLRPDAVYAPYAAARGKPARGLTTKELSMAKRGRCTIECNKRRRLNCPRTDCVVIKDVLAVVPREHLLTFSVFYHNMFKLVPKNISEFTRCMYPPSKTSGPSIPESRLTSYLLSCNVVISPLSGRVLVARPKPSCAPASPCWLNQVYGRRPVPFQAANCLF